MNRVPIHLLAKGTDAMSSTDQPDGKEKENSANAGNEKDVDDGEKTVTQDGHDVTAHIDVTSDEREDLRDRPIVYAVKDNPPFLMVPVYGLQQALLTSSSILLASFLISGNICAGKDLPEVRAQLLNIGFFMSGLATLLQTIFGVRLPVVQGSALSYISTVIIMMKLDQWRCPSPDEELDSDEDEPWKIRLRELQGNLMLASLVQVFLGVTGLVGLLLTFIGPVTIAPTIALIGLGLTEPIVGMAAKHWGVAALTGGMVLLFSLWLGRIQFPVLRYSKERGCHTRKFPVLVVISILLALGLGWLFCYLLTRYDVLPSESTNPAYFARTDIKVHLIEDAEWFKFPLPLVFGTPTFSVAGFFTMFVATLSSILDSLADYFACARISEALPPPSHAVNRGIAIEGFCGVLCGLLGAGHTTSYSRNLAAITVTRVASRRVFQMAGLILLVLGLVNKFGEVMAIIPDPVVGGLNLVVLGTLVAVGMSTLGFTRMDSPRNTIIVGLSFMLGLAIPEWVNAEPGRIDTGNSKADQVLQVLLGTPMILGALVGCILDNLAPGTKEERGIIAFQQNVSISKAARSSDQSEEEREKEIRATYDLPLVSPAMRRIGCCAYIPFLPPFEGFRPKRENQSEEEPVSHDPEPGIAHDNEAFEADSIP